MADKQSSKPAKERKPEGGKNLGASTRNTKLSSSKKTTNSKNLKPDSSAKGKKEGGAFKKLSSVASRKTVAEVEDCAVSSPLRVVPDEEIKKELPPKHLIDSKKVEFDLSKKETKAIPPVKPIAEVELLPTKKSYQQNVESLPASKSEEGVASKPPIGLKKITKTPPFKALPSKVKLSSLPQTKAVPNKEAPTKKVLDQEKAPATPQKLEKAIKLFSDEGDSELNSGMSELSKADLTHVGQNASLRSRFKKNVTEEENLILRKELIQVARKLLKVAGTSVEDLNGEAHQKRKKSLTAVRQQLVSAKEQSYKDQDISVLTNAELSKFEPSKLALQSNESKDGFTPSSAISQENDDPFNSLDAEGDKSKTLGAQKEFVPSRGLPVASQKKSGFHYLGIFATVIFFFGGLAVAIIFLTNRLTGKKNNDYAQAPNAVLPVEQVASAAPLVRTQSKVRIDPESALVAEAQDVILNFLTADNKRFAYTFIVPKKGISKLFNRYWEKTVAYDESLLTYQAGYTGADNVTCLLFLYGKEKEQRQLILSKAEDNPFRIDWQAYSEVEGISLSDLVKEVKTEPFLLRAWVRPEHFYNVIYSDQHWQNYLAHDLKGNTLSCYVPLSTQSAQALYQKIVKFPVRYSKGGNMGTYAVLMVRKPKIGANFVEIIEVLSTSWLPPLLEKE